jgi:hypothetical protein
MIGADTLVAEYRKKPKGFALYLLKEHATPSAIYHILVLFRHLPDKERDELMVDTAHWMDRNSWRTYDSKYEQTCIFCDGEIHVGDTIAWKKPAGISYVAHLRCFFEKADLKEMEDSLIESALMVLRKKLQECREENTLLRQQLGAHDETLNGGEE